MGMYLLLDFILHEVCKSVAYELVKIKRKWYSEPPFLARFYLGS
jgi:hypothetical protein